MLVLVLLVLVVSYGSSLRAWLQQRDDLATTRAEIASTQASIDDLRDRKERLGDPAYLEVQARTRFGWVLPGEVGYRVIDEDGDVLGGTDTLEDAPRTEPEPETEWYDDLWGTSEQAGGDDAR